MSRAPAALVLLLAGCHLALPLAAPPDRDSEAPEAGADLAADLAADSGSDGWPAVFPDCPPPVRPDDGTLALFRFAGATGPDVTDLTGQHTLTLEPAAELQTDGSCGQVAWFPGQIDAYGVIPDHPGWQLTAGSVDLWFRLDQPSVSNSGDLLSRDAKGQAASGHLTLVRAGDYLVARLQDTQQQSHRCHQLTLDEKWHHVGVNFGPPGLQMFVDGTEVPAAGSSVDIPGYGTAVDCSTATTLGINGNENPWVVGAGARVSTDGAATPVNAPMRGAIDNLRISTARRNFGAEARCWKKYGSAPGFVLCESTADTCSFNAQIQGTHCGALCAQVGGACIDAWDNSNNTGEECIKLGAVPCDDVEDTNICVCSQ